MAKRREEKNGIYFVHDTEKDTLTVERDASLLQTYGQYGAGNLSLDKGPSKDGALLIDDISDVLEKALQSAGIKLKPGESIQVKYQLIISYSPKTE